jgi:hypothetical protein
MNKRFEELAEQCGYRSNPDIYDRNQSFDIPKFARFIVQECIQSLWTEDCHVSDLAVEEYNRNANKIKQHFGIKE